MRRTLAISRERQSKVQRAVLLHSIFCASLLSSPGSNAFPFIKVLGRMDTLQFRF